MKKICALGLSLALSASLAAPAFAAEEVKPVLISAPLSYGYTITVNGTKLDTAGLPSADKGYIPMRLVAESDHGAANWFAEENSSAFYMDGFSVNVSFADNALTVGETKLETPAIVKNGVTFLPLSVFDGLEGYTVTQTEDQIDIVTPNNSTLIQLAYSIIGEIEMGSGMKMKSEDLKTNYNIPVESFSEVTAFFPMIISADTIIIGKLNDKADVEAIKAATEAYRKNQEATFEWYLSQNLDRVKNAKTVVNGDYFMFIIAENADKGVELFNDFVKNQK